MQCTEAASSRVARHSCKDRKNRVVTIGVDLPLEVFKTANGRGWGVRCSSHIPIGGFVCDYVGKLMTDTEAVSLYHHAVSLLWCRVCVVCKREVTGNEAVSHVASCQN